MLIREEQQSDITAIAAVTAQAFAGFRTQRSDGARTNRATANGGYAHSLACCDRGRGIDRIYRIFASLDRRVSRWMVWSRSGFGQARASNARGRVGANPDGKSVVEGESGD